MPDDKVYRMHKEMCGLRQAPLARNTKLDNTLNHLCFVNSPSEHTKCSRGERRSYLLLGVYLIINSADTDYIRCFKKEMTVKLRTSDLGMLRFYLGIEFQQNVSGITLFQGA
jgi:hypothetical protein